MTDLATGAANLCSNERQDLLRALQKCADIATCNVSDQQREITDSIIAIARAAIAAGASECPARHASNGAA